MISKTKKHVDQKRAMCNKCQNSQGLKDLKMAVIECVRQKIDNFNSRKSVYCLRTLYSCRSTNLVDKLNNSNSVCSLKVERFSIPLSLFVLQTFQKPVTCINLQSKHISQQCVPQSVSVSRQKNWRCASVVIDFIRAECKFRL